MKLAVAAALLSVLPWSFAQAQSSQETAFLIVGENHNWLGTGGIAGSTEAP